MSSNYPSNFLAANAASDARRPNLVFKIDGVSTVYALAKTYAEIPWTYGSAITYGQAGIFYGGSGVVETGKPYIMDDSALSISQRIEPEQGRGSTGDITVVLIDKDQEITQLVSPGQVVPDILARECSLWYGYQNTDYPEDYFILFRGYITNVVTQAGKVRLTISDATQKKRQATTQAYKSSIYLPMDAASLYFSPVYTAQLTDNVPVLNINGVYDPMIASYFKIGDEYVLQDPAVTAGFETSQPNSISLLARGQLSTAATAKSPVTVAATLPATSLYLDANLNGTNFSAAVPNGSYGLAPTGFTSFIITLKNAMATAWAAAGGNVNYSFDVRFWVQSVGWTSAVSDSLTYLFSGNNPNQYKFLIEVRSTDAVIYPITSFRLNFASGANAANSLRTVLGFANADYTGGQSYISPNYLNMESVAIEQSMIVAGHPLDVALTMMLSGHQYTGQACGAVGSSDGITSNSYAILLPAGVDAKRDYGLTSGLGASAEVTKLGDRVSITGSVYPANNQNCIITDIRSGPDNDHQVLIVQPSSGTLTFDTSGTIKLGFRSKYDRLPTNIGLKIPMALVDVEGHEAIRDIYLSDAGYQISPLLAVQTVGKEFIESQCYLPFGCYAVTKFGRLSLGITKPPIPGTTLVVLNKNNITNPQNITVTRGLNNRRFFNQIQYQYDKGTDGKYATVYRALDTDSLNLFDIQNILPINSDGIKTTYNGANTGSPAIVEDVAQSFLRRFALVASEIKLTVLMDVGSRIEAGDIIQLEDDGTLGVSNFDTGERDLGTNLFEVIDRTLDVKAGTCSLTLLSNVGFLSSDRFGGISPSSYIDTSGSSAAPTPTSFSPAPSFGSVFGAQEYKKWENYVGQRVVVRTVDQLTSAQTVITGVTGTDATNAYGRITVSPALPFVPTSNYVIDLYDYDATAGDPDNYSHSVHAYLDPALTVLTGVSNTEFTISNADGAKIFVGSIIYLHDTSYANLSSNVTVTQKTVGATTSIRVNASLGFTPSASQLVELIGFTDDSSNGYMFS